MRTTWKTLADVKVPDIAEWVAEATRTGQHLHIGTDSLQSGRYTQFVTVVAILNPPHGGRAAYYREVVTRITSLRERLLKEVWHSIEVAMQLSDIVKGDLTCHIDANTQERYMSSKYVQELVGLVVGQGFKVMVKPDAWCASHASDHIVRTKGKVPREVPRLGLNPRVRRTA
jgi:predicted RNase H-related nuclease YkuK (DUF458 family)